MGAALLSCRQLADLLRTPAHETTGAVVCTLDEPDVLGTAPSPGSHPMVVIGIGAPSKLVAAPAVFDVVLAEGDPLLDHVLHQVDHHPVAATSLAVLLRAGAALPVDDALGAESAVYSLLQSGSEFAAWRATARHRPAAPTTEPAVLAQRDGDVLQLWLNRPARHNAFGRDLRDRLSELLALAVLDDSVQRVELRGNGPSFCSGGDLGEFGSFVDPADAHLTRLTRSPARLMHRLAGRTSVHLHGSCLGAGIELAAFAAHVSADADATIGLPEIGLGLIPGAGGTVSITRRAGRQRCALLALSGQPIDAPTALAWGLIDEIVRVGP